MVQNPKEGKGLRKEKLPSSHLPQPRRDNQSILPYLPPRDSLCTHKDTLIRMLNLTKLNQNATETQSKQDNYRGLLSPIF